MGKPLGQAQWWSHSIPSGHLQGHRQSIYYDKEAKWNTPGTTVRILVLRWLPGLVTELSAIMRGR